MSDVSIYVVSHKKSIYPDQPGYIPIQVGKAITKVDLKILSDDIGDNISAKNRNYCELTALYWIWKNDFDSKILGLCHYRRYFFKNGFSTELSNILSEDDIKKILKHKDVILPRRLFWGKRSVAQNYYGAGGKKDDLMRAEDVILKLYPEYLEDYRYVLDGNNASYCNMLITSSGLFKEYCEWLFNILFQLEKMVDLSTYSDQEARIFGYLSEILINVWIRHKRLNIEYICSFNREQSLIDRIKAILINMRNKIIGKNCVLGEKKNNDD